MLCVFTKALDPSTVDKKCTFKAKRGGRSLVLAVLCYLALDCYQSQTPEARNRIPSMPSSKSWYARGAAPRRDCGQMSAEPQRLSMK